MSNTSSNYTAQKDDSKLKYKTGAWTAEEDVKLLEMVGNQKEIQMKWKRMSVILNRDAKLIREHYMSVLDPNLKKPGSKWTEEEDLIILNEEKDALYQNRKPQWTKIARQLKRSKKAVYSHFKYKLSGSRRLNQQIRNKRKSPGQNEVDLNNTSDIKAKISQNRKLSDEQIFRQYSEVKKHIKESNVGLSTNLGSSISKNLNSENLSREVVTCTNDNDFSDLSVSEYDDSTLKYDRSSSINNDDNTGLLIDTSENQPLSTTYNGCNVNLFWH